MNINECDITEIKVQIKIAREWALVHFNAKEANNSKLINDDFTSKPSFFVEFPALDRMEVWPSLMGWKGPGPIEYRLAFNPLEWHGTNPLTGQPMPKLKVKIEMS